MVWLPHSRSYPAVSYEGSSKPTSLLKQSRETNAVPLLYLTELSPLRCVCHLCFSRFQIRDSYPLTEFPLPCSRIRNETPCPLLPTLHYIIYPAGWCSNEPVGLRTFLWYTLVCPVGFLGDILKKSHCSILENGGHALAQLALCYKSEGRGFDSRWSHWNFSLT